MNEDIHTAEWIVTRLESDTGTNGLFDPARSYKPSGAYFGVIPRDKELPAIRFQVQDARDQRGLGKPTTRIMTTIEWLVVLTAEGNELAKMLPLVDRIDTLLHHASGSTATISVDECVRLSPFSLIEPEDSGVAYRHVGGLYRTIVTA